MNTVAKKKLSEKTAEKLYDTIIHNSNLAPGSKLPSEPELAQLFGVSRTTLRAAIQSLSDQGILVVERGKGTFIAGQGVSYESGDNIFFKDLKRLNKKVKEMFEFRLVFEPETARLACIHGEKRELDEIIRQGEYVMELANAGKPWVEEDEKFHGMIVQATHNQYILQYLPLLDMLFSEGIFLSCSEEQMKALPLRDNPNIIQALRARDGESAKYAAYLHVKHVMETLQIIP